MRRTVATLASLALLVSACGGADPDPSATTDAATSAEPDVVTDDAADEPEEAPEQEPDTDAADDAPEPSVGTTAEPEAPDPVTDDEPSDPEAAGGAASAPEPNPREVENPCADHEGHDDEGFIDLVAPVDGQVVGDEVELVGCSNVFEATVSYRLEDEAGTVFDEGFTTAECGSGCVGEFRETVDLTPAGDTRAVFLRVFSQNMADDGDPELFPAVRVVVRDGR